jgi:hypothetical protein
MGKSKDKAASKEVKRKPQKSLKERRAEKRKKKQGG